ncbi:MAG TPA: glycosyltransferase family 4 protein [Chroococcales cyanobacterium]
MHCQSIPRPPDVTSKALSVAHLLIGEKIWGVENYVLNLSQAMPDSVRTLIVCPFESAVSKKFRDAGFPVFIVPMNGYCDVAAINALATLFREHGVNVVHTHLGIDSFIGTIAASLSGAAVVQSVHFDNPAYMSNGKRLIMQLWRGIQFLKNQKVAHFLPITENVGAELAKREFVSRKKITVVHPGVVAPLEVSPDERKSIRAQMGVRDNEVVISAVGRLEPEKNFSCLIEAAGAIVEKQLPIKVWIAGDGSQMSKLRTQVEQNNMTGIISLLGYRSDAGKLLSASDIFVLPSLAEPFGMAAAEAMAAGVPVIGTEGPGLSTIIDHGETGLLVKPSAVGELAAAIETLTFNSALRTKFGIAGKAKALSCFSPEVMSTQILRIYESVGCSSAES